jgi:hypothetical protein
MADLTVNIEHDSTRESALRDWAVRILHDPEKIFGEMTNVRDPGNDNYRREKMRLISKTIGISNDLMEREDGQDPLGVWEEALYAEALGYMVSCHCTRFQIC